MAAYTAEVLWFRSGQKFVDNRYSREHVLSAKECKRGQLRIVFAKFNAMVIPPILLFHDASEEAAFGALSFHLALSRMRK